MTTTTTQGTVPEHQHRPWEFTLKSIEDLLELAESLGVEISAQEDVSCLAEPVAVGTKRIPNSLAIHPMEGCDGDSLGRPERLTLRRYDRFAAGGAGLLWMEATAVVSEGRANPRQLWLHEGSREAFVAMAARIRQTAAEHNGANHQPLLIAQLTQSGRYSKPTGKAEPMIPQHDPYRDVMIPQQRPNKEAPKRIPTDWPTVTDDYLDGLQESFVEAARIAFEAGFDGVDVKSCHGYLVNELLACHQRPGKYGGSFENRTRFMLEVIDKIRAEFGEDKLIATRMGVYDAIPYPYGWGVDREDYRKPDLTEPKKLIGLLRERGVKLINVTIANPYYNPHCNRPFSMPIIGGYEEPEHPLAGVARLINLTAELQREFPDVALVGTGYTWLRTLMAPVAAANKAQGKVTLAGGGRMGFAYPDFPRDIIQKGRMDPQKVCVSCSACTQIMRDGGRAGCVVRDNAVYGPIFRQGRMSDRENLQRLAQSCLQCQEPSCQVACPAGIDIPTFIDQFLHGDEKGAYETIRQANILPEVCAWLCPVEQQCQGHCLQGFIGDGALPIADIQRYLAEKANAEGWSRLKVPEKTTGKRVAVIGAGPAGLACAAELLEEGHIVTLYDKSEKLGGMIRSVIPPDRQSRSLEHEIAAIFTEVPDDRLILKQGRALEGDFTLDSIMAEGYEAAFIGLGLSEPAFSSPERMEGLWDALTFLKTAKAAAPPDLTGKTVAVIGGGNTAMDVAVTARELGARDVLLIYRRSFAEMPAWTAERDRALNRGIHFVILTQQLGYESEGGRLTRIKVCPTRLGEPDSSGRRRPLPVKESAYSVEVDVVVESIGQQAPANLVEVLEGVEWAEGLIKTRPDSSQTARDGVYAGGDLVRGASTVVAAVADGMKAAREIAAVLRGDGRS